MQFLVNGMSNKNKYDLHFDLGRDNNNKLLNVEEERIKFHDKLRKKLAKEYNINEENFIITFPRKGSYQLTVIFKSEDFQLNENELMMKFKNEKELGTLKKMLYKELLLMDVYSILICWIIEEIIKTVVGQAKEKKEEENYISLPQDGLVMVLKYIMFMVIILG